MSIWRKSPKAFVDASVTIVLWIYFTLGFVVFFSPVYMAAFFFSSDRRGAFQNLNHRFLRGFLGLLRTIVPGLTVEIDPRIFDLRSCVVVSNHRSYLDPVLLVAVFKKHTTIVKSAFFRFPVFGGIISASGYIPAEGSGRQASLLVERIRRMDEYLSEGGVLFVFPEGTRSRSGRIGPFNRGSFKIARRCNAPLEVILITNTEKLFPPGQFLFNTCVENKIEVRWIGRIPPDDGRQRKIDDVMADVGTMMEENLESRQGASKIGRDNP